MPTAAGGVGHAGSSGRVLLGFVWVFLLFFLTGRKPRTEPCFVLLCHMYTGAFLRQKPLAIILTKAGLLTLGVGFDLFLLEGKFKLVNKE